jgi:hypothetical protein
MRIYDALNDIQGKIHFPNYVTEGDVQSDVVSALKKDGFLVKTMLGFKRSLKNAGCEFDIVVFADKHTAVAIIENKSPLEGPATDLDATHQGLKYRGFGIPVILFWDMKYYNELREFLKKEKLPTVKPVKINTESLKRLHKSLDIASMAAYDLGMTDLVEELERKRDLIQEQLR